MATYFVASGGSNTAPYDTWAKAATSLATALAAATATGDIVVIQYNAVPSADTAATNRTYTAVASISLISASNDGGSAYTATAMGTTNYVGSSGDNNVTFNGAFDVYVYGFTFRQAGGSVITVNSSDGGSWTLDNCQLRNISTSNNGSFVFGSASGNSRTRMIGGTLFSGRTTNGATVIRALGRCTFEGVTVTVSTTSTSAFILANYGNSTYGSSVWVGCDFSSAPSGASLFADETLCTAFHVLDRCKLPANCTVLTAQTLTNESSAVVEVRDCASGNTHGLFGYYTATGAIVSDSGIYFTSGAAGQSWKVVTTSSCNDRNPFVTPWISFYNTGMSAITPYFEILRDGSTTAYNDNEVWAEFARKGTAGSTQASFANDKGAGSAQAAGAGLGSWTGESGTAWSGKCDSGSSITPAAAGHISGRILVAAASATVYVDPQIRT